MRLLILSAACATLLACGSSDTTGKTADMVGTLPPEMKLTQLIGPEQLQWQTRSTEVGGQAGQLELKYALDLSNRAAEPITLRQIQVKSVGSEGPYRIPQASFYFREAIAPGESKTVSFFPKADSEGNRYRIDAQAPVTIRIIAYFESPKGSFRQTFITSLGQSFKETR